MRVLVTTTEWATPQMPGRVPFLARQVDSLRREGVEVSVLSFRGGKNPARYAQAWVQLRQRQRMARYDLVHAQFAQAGIPGIPKGLPLVVTFRGDDPVGIVGSSGRYTFAGAVLRQISRMVAYLADEVIVVAASLARYLPARTFHVIPSGVDLDRFQPMPRQTARRELGLSSGKQFVLFPFAPDNPVKRFGLAKAAVALAGRPNTELLSVSGVPHERMPLYMNACDLLLLTSRHEGSSNAVKEALACNLPVVSVDVGDIRERLGSVAGCRVTADHEPATIAEALRTVLLEARPVAGRATVMGIDEKVIAKKIIQVYRMAIQRRRERTRGGG
jgi:glycosyltransferase involved in cell wall biosynthesis